VPTPVAVGHDARIGSELKQRRSRREERVARNESSDAADGESLARLWLEADPAPPQVAEAAKAAFARHQRAVTVLTKILEIRGGSTDADAGPPADLLVFGDECQTIEVEVRVDAGSETVTLRCSLRDGRTDPSAVTAESPSVDHPMVRSSAGLYGADGLPHGPLRVAVEFPDGPARTVATSWFTA
jgi:hypothetical protein